MTGIWFQSRTGRWIFNQHRDPYVDSEHQPTRRVNYSRHFFFFFFFFFGLVGCTPSRLEHFDFRSFARLAFSPNVARVLHIEIEEKGETEQWSQRLCAETFFSHLPCIRRTKRHKRGVPGHRRQPPHCRTAIHRHLHRHRRRRRHRLPVCFQARPGRPGFQRRHRCQPFRRSVLPCPNRDHPSSPVGSMVSCIGVFDKRKERDKGGGGSLFVVPVKHSLPDPLSNTTPPSLHRVGCTSRVRKYWRHMGRSSRSRSRRFCWKW